jgi:hypothetical protein
MAIASGINSSAYSGFCASSCRASHKGCCGGGPVWVVCGDLSGTLSFVVFALEVLEVFVGLGAGFASAALSAFAGEGCPLEDVPFAASDGTAGDCELAGAAVAGFLVAATAAPV